MFLVLGVRFDEGSGQCHTFSLGYDWSGPDFQGDPQTISNMLAEAGGQSFEQILILQNGSKGPDVIRHWNQGKEYK